MGMCCKSDNYSLPIFQGTAKSCNFLISFLFHLEPPWETLTIIEMVGPTCETWLTSWTMWPNQLICTSIHNFKLQLPEGEALWLWAWLTDLAPWLGQHQDWLKVSLNLIWKVGHWVSWAGRIFVFQSLCPGHWCLLLYIKIKDCIADWQPNDRIYVGKIQISNWDCFL